MSDIGAPPGIAAMYAADQGQPTARISQNMEAADRALRLSPEEKALYQRHLANLWGSGGVDNPDGSRSTLYNATVDNGGKAYVIPTVYDGRILPVDAAVDRAAAQGWGTFPSYPTPGAADARYVDQMHPFLDKDTGMYMDVRRNAPMAPPTVANMFRQP